MANATAKDIQDLAKSIQALVSTFGTSSTKSTSKRPAFKQSQSEPESDDAIGKLESKRAAQKEEEAFQQRMADYNKTAIDSTKQLAANQKAWGTEQYKSLNLTEQISDLTYDIYDVNEKYLDAKRSGNKVLEKEYRLLLKDLRARRQGLDALEETAKVQDKGHKLAEKQLATYKKITDSIKDPVKALTGIADGLSESMGKRFNASLAAPKRSIMEIATTGLKFGVVAAFGMGVKRAFEMNQELTDMRRNIGLSAEEASHVHHELQDATLSSTVLGATSHDTAAAFESLRDTFGTAVASNHELINSQVLLTKQIGMTNEEAASFQSMSAGTGESAQYNLGIIQQQVEEYNVLHGASVSIRDVQKDVAKVSKTTFAAYKGNTKELARAVLQAKKLGMSLDDTATISRGLLEIESSLSAEMEASVLTGRSVNMNAARQLALQGKSAEAAAAAMQQVGSYDEFMDMNILQQEALAKAAGMTVDQIVKAGQEEKKRAIMGEKNFRQLNDKEKERLKTVLNYTDAELKDLANQQQAADVKERIVQLTDKMMTGFDEFITNSIEPWLHYLEKGLGIINELVAGSKAFIKQSFPTWAIDLMKGAGSLLKGAAAIGVGLVVLRKSFGMVSGFLSGKAGDSKSKPIWARIVDGAKAVKGAMGRGVDRVKSFGGGVVDKVKSIGGFGKGLFDKFKTFKSTKKEGGWKAGLKSLFTKENLAEMTGAATGVASDAITETPVTDTGIAPLGTEADPIYVKVIGGISGGTATDEAADAGGNPLVDAGLDMFKDSKIGKKFSKMTGGLSDTLSDEVGGGGMGGDSTAAATDAAPLKKDGTPDKRFKANKAPSSSPAPSTPSSGGKGGGFFSGLIDKVKSSKFVGKVGDFAKKLNPLSKLKEWIPKLFSSKGTMSKLLGKLPKIGTIINMASTIYGLGTAAASSESLQDIGSQVLDSIGSMGGSFLAGALGSVVPGAGTILGSMLGGMAGSSLAGLIADNVDLTGLGKTVVDIFGAKGAEQGENPVAVADALIRPGMPPITFDKGDMILAGTNLMGGGAEAAPAANNQGSLSEVAGLLKQLIAATSQPVKINIGGKVIDEIEKQTTLRKTYNTKVDNVHGAF